MAEPSTQDLVFVRGDTETLSVTMTTDGTTAIDITGRTYSSQLRTAPDATVISATATCTVPTGTDGKVTVVFPATQTASLSPGFFYWDLQENASGTITTVLKGEVTVLADVTR
jgi:hypothetical protein